MYNFLLSPSILSSDFTRLGDQIREAERAGADWIHVDVMDGHFVPNISMGPVIVEACRRITALPLDVHLMIEKPERFVQDFIHAGATHLTVHIEGNPHVHRTLGVIRELGASPGIVLNPGTPAASLEAVLPFVDMVLVMSVNPGFSGQKYIPTTPRKIAQIRAMMQALGVQANIEVDGGITAETLPACAEAGANVFVAATSVFKHPGGVAAGIAALRSAGA